MAKKNIGTKVKVSKSKEVKSSRPEKVKIQKDKSNAFTYILVLIVIAAIVAVALNWDKISQSNNEQIAASVNGEIITVSELDQIYNRLPPQTRAVVTKQDLLAQMINEKVLVQRAHELGLEVSDDEVNDFLNGLVVQSGLTEEQFEERLKEQNISIDLVKDEIYKQLLITDLYQTEIVDKINVSETEIEDYYLNNIDSFKVDEQVHAEHILICHNESTMCDSNLTREQALAKANEILDMLNDSNFEELAKEFSMGPSAPNGGDLGYFGRGVMVSQFEDAAFSLNVDEVSQPVETSFGYHIIKVVDKTDESYQSLDDVKDDIRTFLVQQKQQEAFKEYLDNLKTGSNVINFYEKSVVATTK